jgi:hypothetical protein
MLEIIATIFTMTGFFMIQENKKSGFYISGISNIMWIIWGIGIVNGAFYVLQLTLLIISIKGIFKNG